MKTNWALFLGCAAITLTALAVSAAELPPPANKSGVTYATDIKPLFERSCVKCHNAEKAKAGVRLDALDQLLKSRKKVITPGQSETSKIVQCAAGVCKDKDQNMPPKGKADPFTKDEVGLLRAWIDQGAK
ncbi:MAG: c-type cytochrome domain-containing protein [Verrucomicrobiota bacterium]